MDRLRLRGRARRAGVLGPSRASDVAVVAPGTVHAVDPVAGTAQVSVRGGVITLPALPARYGATCKVLLDPTSGRPVMVLGTMDPDSVIQPGTVAAVGTTTVTVTVAGVTSTVPIASGTYQVGQTAWVLTDDWGTPVVALGDATIVQPALPPPPATVPKPKPRPAPPDTPSTVSAKATLGPSTSGTYRAGYGWDRWNAGRYGGASDVYQGNKYGSGVLSGFVGFGSRIVNLRAVSIESITMRIKKTDTNGLAANFQVQGSASGSKPGGVPASSGDIVSSGDVGPGEWDTITFTSDMRDKFRTGVYRGLVAVGSDYGAMGGTGTPGSCVLTIKYTKNA